MLFFYFLFNSRFFYLCQRILLFLSFSFSLLFDSPDDKLGHQGAQGSQLDQGNHPGNQGSSDPLKKGKVGKKPEEKEDLTPTSTAMALGKFCNIKVLFYLFKSLKAGNITP